MIHGIELIKASHNETLVETVYWLELRPAEEGRNVIGKFPFFSYESKYLRKGHNTTHVSRETERAFEPEDMSRPHHALPPLSFIGTWMILQLMSNPPFTWFLSKHFSQLGS